MLKEIEKTLRSHPFVTPWYLQNAHIQTIFCDFVPYFKINNLKPERKFITVADGTQIAIDCFWQPNKKNCPTILVFDGLGASGSSSFSLGMTAKAYYSGYNVITVYPRWTKTMMHLSKSLYDGGFDNDGTYILEEIITWGLKNIFIVGYSAGGYYALASVIRSKKQLKQYVKGIISISAAFDAYVSHVEKNPFYHRVLLKTYKNFVKQRIPFDPPGTWNIEKVGSAKTIYEFRQAIMHNLGYPERFSNFEEAYEKVDLKPFLKNFPLPLLIIHAADDPVNPVIPFTESAVQNNPKIITLLPKHGGHGGFFILKPNYGDLDGHWAQNRAMEFIKLLNKK